MSRKKKEEKPEAAPVEVDSNLVDPQAKPVTVLVDESGFPVHEPEPAEPETPEAPPAKKDGESPQIDAEARSIKVTLALPEDMKFRARANGKQGSYRLSDWSGEGGGTVVMGQLQPQDLYMVRIQTAKGRDLSKWEVIATDIKTEGPKGGLSHPPKAS